MVRYARANAEAAGVELTVVEGATGESTGKDRPMLLRLSERCPWTHPSERLLRRESVRAGGTLFCAYLPRGALVGGAACKP